MVTSCQIIVANNLSGLLGSVQHPLPLALLPMLQTGKVRLRKEAPGKKRVWEGWTASPLGFFTGEPWGKR